MKICDTCIMAIRSRGETVYTGDTIHSDENDMTCEWCKIDGFDELIEVRFE